MKILYLTDADLAPHKAPQIHVSQFLKHWHQEGCEVLLRAPRTQGEMPTFEFPHEWLGYLNMRLLGDWLLQRRMYKQLKCELQEKRWDVVYTRQISTFPALYRLCRKMGVPVLCEVNGFLLENYVTGGASAWKLGAVERMEAAILQYSHLLVVPYAALKKRMCRHYDLPSEKVVVVENGVDLNLFYPISREESRQSLQLDKDAFYVGFVGSFDFYHDLETLLASYGKLAATLDKQLRYLLVGDGLLREDMQRKVRILGFADAVDFVGAVPHREVATYINAADVMVSLQPLKRMEKLGEASSLKVKEYLACGVPVVLSHILGQTSSFDKICIHVPPEDEKALVEAIVAVSEGHAPHYDTQSIVAPMSWECSANKVLQKMYALRDAACVG